VAPLSSDNVFQNDEDGTIVMSKEVPLFECRFERTCTLADAGFLLLDYTLTSYSDEPVKYIYSAHPMLARQIDPKLVIPCHYDLFADNSLPPNLLRTNLMLYGMQDRYKVVEHAEPFVFPQLA